MCLQNEIKATAQQLNNHSFIFDEVKMKFLQFSIKKQKLIKNVFQQPTKPKLSTRMFVNSAKINLNKYWNKLEKIVSATSIIKKNKKKLRKLKIINQQLLNNQIFPVKQKEVETKNDEIYGFIPAKFTIPKTENGSKPTYKPFIDDSLYHDIIPTLMTSESKLPENTPCFIHKAYDNYNFYLNECRRQQETTYHNNDNALYIQQLNESLRRKGYKFTLADVDRCSSALDSSMYYKGQYLEDEGYLV